jgi:hypothetical protein
MVLCLAAEDGIGRNSASDLLLVKVKLERLSWLYRYVHTLITVIPIVN